MGQVRPVDPRVVGCRAMSRRRWILVLAFVFLLMFGLSWALTQQSPCRRSQAMLALTCKPGYEPR
jgi:hypothetical protein